MKNFLTFCGGAIVLALTASIIMFLIAGSAWIFAEIVCHIPKI